MRRPRRRRRPRLLKTEYKLEFPVRSEEINDKFYCRIFSVVVPRSVDWCYVIASYLGSNRIFKIFNTKWS